MKRFALCLACAATLLAPALVANAQSYPDKLVTVTVPWPAGGPSDVQFRQMQPSLQAQLAQPVMIDNVPGAGGSIGVQKVLRARADGHTVLGTSASDLILAPLSIAAAKYDPLQFRLIAPVAITDFVLISSLDAPFKGIDDLLSHAKQPGAGQLSIGHWGRGSISHVVAADFQNRTGIRLLEVPYKGTTLIVPDLLNGQVKLAFLPLVGLTIGLIQTGKVRAIGIAAAQRHPTLPDVPTLNEGKSLRGFEHTVWTGVFVDRKVGNAEAAKLAQAANTALRSPEFGKFLAEQGARGAVEPMTLAKADDYFKSEIKRLSRIGREIRLQPE